MVRTAIWIVALVSAVLLGACNLKPVDAVEPTPIGVIDAVRAEGDLLRLVMEDGTEFTVDLDRDTPMYGNTPDEGDLFLVADEAADGLRYVSFSDSRSSGVCPFPVDTAGAWEEQDSVVFGTGPFRFPKASSFQRPPWQESDFYAEDPVFCLNEEAQVLGELSHLQLP